MYGNDDWGSKCSQGSGSVWANTKYLCRLWHLLSLHDGGGVSEMELVDVQCNIQILRGAESEYIRLKKGHTFYSFVQLIGHKKGKEQWPSAVEFS